MDLLGALAKESSNEEPAHPAIAIRAVGGEAEAVLLAWLRPPQGQGTEPFGPLGAEHPQQSVEMSDASASQQIDDIVRRTAGWRGERLSQLRALIRGADPGVIEEVKWKKTSRPEGVPVWSDDGIVCGGPAAREGQVVRLIRKWDSGRSRGNYHQSSSGSCSMVVDHQRHFHWATQPRDRHRRRRRFGPNTRLGGAVRHELAFTTTTARGDSSPAASDPARGHDGGGDVQRPVERRSQSEQR